MLCNLLHNNFYPRSPCGERRASNQAGQQEQRISIHALLAESDKISESRYRQTSDFYPRSPCGERQQAQSLKVATLSISIHALLAESDCTARTQKAPSRGFLSTLSLRRATPDERHASSQQEFLSTLSLRRATTRPAAYLRGRRNFYPRSPCGERPQCRL